jgi:hypothetical protein
MKLIRASQDQFRFELSQEEKNLLNILQLYPLVPAAHHRLSKGRQIPNREENQQLLEESMKAQREENRKKVVELLNEPKRFTECAAGYRTKFTRGEIEWLLQVLNDIRVGCWLALGSPDEHPEMKQGMSNQTMSQIATMEIAAFFQMGFLHAVSGNLQPGHE